MANDNIPAPAKTVTDTLDYEIHEVASSLAGVEEVLLNASDLAPVGIANSLHLMAKIVADANDKLCHAADRVGSLRKSDLEA